MKVNIRRANSLSWFVLGSVLVGLVFVLLSSTTTSFADDGSGGNSISEAQSADGNFITIYDSGEKLTLKSTAGTVAEVLERAEISLEKNDIVEPGLDEPIASRNFNINIYRAKPALVEDGARKIYITTALSDPRSIAAAAGVDLAAEDLVEIEGSKDFLEAGMSVSYRVIRAKTIYLSFYGEEKVIKTQSQSIQEFLDSQKIEISGQDWVSVDTQEKITDGMRLEIHRQGKQTISIEEEIDFTEKITYDYSKNAGYRVVTKEGQKGRKTVSYEIEMQDGKEISRVAISEIVTAEAVAQEVTVGAHPIAVSPLTASMGRNRYTTASGILREETYYDLDMSIVMRNCGGGGYYTVREDGVKVDKDGYVIIAAQLDRYPRCTIVETSLGLGKVYDTGGFALVNPEQFDIATDWTKRDGI